MVSFYILSYHDILRFTNPVILKQLRFNAYGIRRHRLLDNIRFQFQSQFSYGFVSFHQKAHTTVLMNWFRIQPPLAVKLKGDILLALILNNRIVHSFGAHSGKAPLKVRAS